MGDDVQVASYNLGIIMDIFSNYVEENTSDFTKETIDRIQSEELNYEVILPDFFKIKRYKDKKKHWVKTIREFMKKYHGNYVPSRYATYLDVPKHNYTDNAILFIEKMKDWH